MPCVALGTHEQIGSLSRLIRVELGGAVGFLRRALEHLAKKKRHRVAMLTVSGAAVSRIDEFRCCARALGLETDPMWIHGVDPWHARWTANVLRLLFRRENPMIPDALIIDDDNLVDHACCGLVAAGVRVPADVEVVSHWNYPIEPPGRIPFIRLGYDSGAALLNCIGLIDKQNRGEETRDSIMLDAVFEWELEETQKRAAAQFANR
ncbi:MAG TPA: substrate-binding domain-containing protein [Candidatus Brocadiia bacterium]|nr:substrate-binding domain-containing protein [Candidatus Brocadiia bacterium]